MWDSASIASGPDGSSRIVWMINRMIKCLPTEIGWQSEQSPVEANGRQDHAASAPKCVTAPDRSEGGSTRSAGKEMHAEPGPSDHHPDTA
jgi:hypothetical protein